MRSLGRDFTLATRAQRGLRRTAKDWVLPQKSALTYAYGTTSVAVT